MACSLSSVARVSSTDSPSTGIVEGREPRAAVRSDNGLGTAGVVAIEASADGEGAAATTGSGAGSVMGG